MSLKPEYVATLSDDKLLEKIKEAQDMILEYKDDKEIANDYREDLKQLLFEDEKREKKTTSTDERFAKIEARITELEQRQRPETYLEK